MIKIVKFKKEHLDIMDIRDHEARLLTPEGAALLETTDGFTGIIDGRIISCGGVLVKENGTGDLWQIPSIYVAQVAIPYARYIRGWVNDLGLSRLDTLCLNDDLHKRWMRFLGFKNDGLQGDLVKWSKVWG